MMLWTKSNDDTYADEFRKRAAAIQAENTHIYLMYSPDLLFGFAPAQVALHLESCTNFIDALFQRDAIRMHGAIIKHDALEKAIRSNIRVLFGINDTTSVPVEQLGKGGNDSLGIWTFNSEDGLSDGVFWFR
jgi:hypothetical protein